LGEIMGSFPPIAATVVLVGAAVVFIVGFARHGHSFLKYGFKQEPVGRSLEKRFDNLESQFSEVKSELSAIKTNHFGHLKNYLGILNGALLDKRVIDNETKARLDNEIRGM